MKQSKFLTAAWRKLIMANYEADPEVLQSFLPAGTQLDFWENKTYISLVGFMFMNTKIKGISIPFHINFPEVNLRFYVRYKSSDNWKRGVVFINEIVPKHAISFIANNLFQENYITCKMKYKWSFKEKIDIGYYWKKNKTWNNLEVTSSSKPVELIANSKEEFITEHYWGYTRINENKTGEYQVEHPRWQIYPVEKFTINCDFKTVFGEQFAFLNNCEPSSIFLAEGSAVNVYSKTVL